MAISSLTVTVPSNEAVLRLGPQLPELILVWGASLQVAGEGWGECVLSRSQARNCNTPGCLSHLANASAKIRVIQGAEATVKSKVMMFRI